MKTITGEIAFEKLRKEVHTKMYSETAEKVSELLQMLANSRSNQERLLTQKQHQENKVEILWKVHLFYHLNILFLFVNLI